MGITGILAAVAIPQYNKYRKNAALGAMGADAANISRATLACASVNPFSSCDTVAEAGIDNIDGVTLGAAKSPNICFQFSRTIAGTTYDQCVSIDVGAGKYTESNSEPFCYEESAGGPDCGMVPLGANCGKHALNLECSTAVDCPVATSPAVAHCVSATAGKCKTTDAECE